MQVDDDEQIDEVVVCLFVVVVTTDHRALGIVRMVKLVSPSKQSMQFC